MNAFLKRRRWKWTEKKQHVHTHTHTNTRSTQSTSRTRMHVNKDRRRNYSNCIHMQMRSFIATYERLQIQIVCVRIVAYKQRLCRAPKTDEWLSFNERHRRASRLHISVFRLVHNTHMHLFTGYYYCSWAIFLFCFSVSFFFSLLPCFYCL